LGKNDCAPLIATMSMLTTPLAVIGVGVGVGADEVGLVGLPLE
jgi:hypothetical protein